MGRKINVNVCIVIAAVAIVVAILASVIAYGLSEKYTDSIKTSTLKSLINMAFPVVDYTYNSGKAEFSIMSQLRESVFGFTGIDTADPVRMISSGNSLHKYYKNKYWDDRFLPGSENPESPENPEETVLTPKPEGTPTPSDSRGPDATQGPSVTPAPSTPKPSGTEGKYAKGNIVTVKNGSKLDIDMDKILKQPFINKFAKSAEGPQILIYHTHTTESYIKDLSELDNNNYDSWSSDNSKTVVKAGHELDTALTKYGFNVMHNSTVHNSKYTESYNKSSITLRSVLKGNPTIKMSIDMHRDGLAIGTGKLRVFKNIKGVDCAKIMFVVGTNETTENPRWEDNLRLAVLLAEKLEEIAPGIMRHVSIRSSRYNQHIAENGLLVEIGGDGNTVAEVTASSKYLAQAMNAVMNE